MNCLLSKAYKISRIINGMGSIVSVSRDGKQKKAYTYDALNRIISEKDIDKEQEICYTYDNNGNILTKSVNGVTTSYAYEEGTDRLTSYGAETIGYDGMGNPKSYRGSELTWEKGRLLTSIKEGSEEVTFGYDVFGLRNKKTAGGETTNYIYENGNLLRQITGSEVMTFIYGSEGIIGFRLGTVKYLYRKNVFGDVEEIYSAEGTLVGKYSYTAFGECEIETDVNGIATKNPFRYRGYYYDVETGLYYLKTRYYDPVVGRFITIDDVSYLAPDTINGLNLYAYCGNNPVMRVDHEGTSWWSDFWNSTIGKIVGTVLVVVAVAAVSILTAGVGTAISGALGGGFVASILGGAVGGAISGAVIGAGFSIVTQGLTNGYGNIDWSQVGTATIKGLISGAITGAVFGFIGASVRGIKILNASRKGLVIGKMGNFESAAKSMNLSYYNGLKGYRLVEKIFGKDLATKIGWAHNKAFVKSVMKLGGAIVDIGGELSGAYAKEVTLTAGYQYLIKLTQLLF